MFSLQRTPWRGAKKMTLRVWSGEREVNAMPLEIPEEGKAVASRVNEAPKQHDNFPYQLQAP